MTTQLSDAAALATHVLLVRSSLQYLLATALAADLRERTQQPCRMLFLPDLLQPDLFHRAADGWSESPFDRIVPIAPRTASASAGPPRSSATVRRELQAALVDAMPASLTVFNDREEAAQALLIAAARHFPQATRLCAEDGSLAYTNFVYRPHSAATRLRQKLRLGHRWHDVRVLGTHPLVQQFIAIHPRLVRAELRECSLRPFPAQALESVALRSLAAAMCRATGFDPVSVSAGATVLTVSHSSYAARNPPYRQMIEACAEELACRTGRFFVKYHPRESQPDYLDLCARRGAVEIARSLPMECLYLMLRDRALNVVGGMSTALLTAALLMPQARCVALQHASSSGDHWDRQLLDELQITPLANVAAIARHFAG